MQITPLTELPERPKPIFDNTHETGTNFSFRRSLETPITFHEETTFFRRPLELGFYPCIQPGELGVAINDDYGVLNISSMSVGQNNIGMCIHRTRVQILEHVVGVLAGLNIDADIFLRSSVVPFRAVSLPTKVDCAQAYADALSNPHLLSEPHMRETCTVAEPTRVDFGNGRGSYAILLPAEDTHELIIDAMVSYPGAVGTQRVRVKITEDSIKRYLAGARTPTYGYRRRLMGLLDRFPVLQNIVDIHSGKTVSIGENGVINPRSEYDVNGANAELLMHEVLDKLGAFGIPFGNGSRFVGTVMVFATNHAQDVAVMRACESGEIPCL